MRKQTLTRKNNNRAAYRKRKRRDIEKQKNWISVGISINHQVHMTHNNKT